jgi:hypothetical protein
MREPDGNAELLIPAIEGQSAFVSRLCVIAGRNKLAVEAAAVTRAISRTSKPQESITCDSSS